jgi:adenylosuccinate lyase
MLRNIGPALGHSLVALSNTAAGLRGLEVDAQALDADLQDAWEVLGEACQSVMRRAGVDRPYERLKELTRGVTVTEQDIHDFLASQPLDAADRDALLALTPATYTGLAAQLVDFASGPGLPPEPDA